jgi:hypothetical protein
VPRSDSHLLHTPASTAGVCPVTPPSPCLDCSLNIAQPPLRPPLRHRPSRHGRVYSGQRTPGSPLTLAPAPHKGGALLPSTLFRHFRAATSRRRLRALKSWPAQYGPGERRSKGLHGRLHFPRSSPAHPGRRPGPRRGRPARSPPPPPPTAAPRIVADRPQMPRTEGPEARRRRHRRRLSHHRRLSHRRRRRRRRLHRRRHHSRWAWASLRWLRRGAFHRQTRPDAADAAAAAAAS